MKIRLLATASVALASSLISFPAFAIVNVEQAIIGPAEDGLTNKVELSIDGASGNTVKNSSSAEWLTQWQHGEHADFIWLQYAYGKSSGKVDTNRFFAHLRHRTQVGENWGAELFAQSGRDLFARMQQRTLGGAGVRYSLLEEAGSVAVYLGLGGFYEYEKLSQKAGTTDALVSRTWRANTYLVLKRQLNEQLRLYSTTYYQPAFSNFQDYRLLEQFAFAVRLDENIDLKLSLDVTYDALPPQGVKKTDARYSTGLSMNF